MYFEHKTVRDVAGQNIDIAAIDYNNGFVALATSKCKTILFYQSQNANLKKYDYILYLIKYILIKTQ